MHFKFYIEKLKDSVEFKNFIKENPKAYFSGGFLAVDIENQGKGDEQHLDYYVPTHPPKKNAKGEFYSFCISKQCQKSLVELKDKEKIPERVSESIDFDSDQIKKIIQDKMDEGNIDNKIQKILLSLQAKDKKNYLIGTVFISNLGIIKIQINLDEMKILEFEKKSIFDMVRRVK